VALAEPTEQMSGEVALTSIRPNPFQPRTVFNPESLAELAASIRENGLIQTLVVRRDANKSVTGYTAVLTDGERVDFDQLDATSISGKTRLAGQEAAFEASIREKVAEIRLVAVESTGTAASIPARGCARPAA